MSWRKIGLIVLILLLSACALPFGSSVAPPPASQLVVEGDHPDVDQLFDALELNISRLLRRQGYAIETIERLQTTDSVTSAAAYYNETAPAQGWKSLPQLVPEGNTGTVLTFQRGDKLLVVTLLDTSSYLEQGVLISVIRAEQ